ncbi:dihydrodipicolinate synthase family protein [Neobacillus drentensis]|uniref:dihydrodipicolinate synthase family protein n=1 Tax=Neobacillus drentensis TaxID=220684 RepID=UPI002FFD77EA
METTNQFYGVIPPVPTILFKEGKLDKKGMGNLIDFLIDSQVNGLFFLGSGGEFGQMPVELRKEVAEFATSYVNGRVPVLIGTGTPSTNETISISKHAKSIGADGVVVVNPYYYKLTEDSLFQHYAEIAKNVELPIILYNYPELTGQDLSPDFVLTLVNNYPNIVGIKDTVLAVGHTRELIQIVKSQHPHFAVFAGYDEHLLNNLALGGDGSIPLTASFAPEVSVGIYQSFKQENFGKAIELHQKLAALLPLYKLDSPFMNVVKEAILLRGIEISTDVLAPVRSLSPEKKELVKSILLEKSTTLS